MSLQLQINEDEKLAKSLQEQDWMEQDETFARNLPPEEKQYSDYQYLWSRGPELPSQRLSAEMLWNLLLLIEEEPPSDLPPVKIQLDKDKYKEMVKEIEYDTSSDVVGACAICQDNFQNKERVRITPCDHIFHPHCISCSR